MEAHHAYLYMKTYLRRQGMNDPKIIYKNIFKKGVPNKEEYTAIWITLINSLIKDQHVLACKEE